MRWTILTLVTGLLLSAAPPITADDDIQYWSQYSFGLYQKDRLTLGIFTEGRFSKDASDLSGVFVGPKLTYRAHPNLWLGLAIKRIDLDGDVSIGLQRLDGGGPQIDGRIELELSPRFRVSERWFFDSRHRMELLHRETRSNRTRFRHLTRWTRSLGDGSSSDPGWSHVFINNELFHEDGEGLSEVNENRFVPFGARWRISPRSSIDLFYMLHSRKIAGDWTHNHVIGTTWTLKP